MTRTRRVFEFDDAPKKKKEELKTEQPDYSPWATKKSRPRTEINWAPQLFPRSIAKIRFLLDCLPSEFHELLHQAAEDRDPDVRNVAGNKVMVLMMERGYDFRKIANVARVSKQEELFELWKGNKCIARLVFSANGESKVVKGLG